MHGSDGSRAQLQLPHPSTALLLRRTRATPSLAVKEPFAITQLAMVSPLPCLKKPSLSLMVLLFQNLEQRQLVFSYPRVSKQEMERPPRRALPWDQSHPTQSLSPLASEPALTPQCTKDLGFLSKHHDLGGFESHENHPVDLLLHISLTSSSPTTVIATLRTYSRGCSVELSSQNYFTSDISEQRIPLSRGEGSLPSKTPAFLLRLHLQCTLLAPLIGP